MTSEAPVRLLYVIGSGRSGSTLLDIILGSHPQVGAYGELTNLPTSGWTNDEFCACGARGTVCPFWSEVRARWTDRCGGDVDRYIELKDEFERFRHLPKIALAAEGRSREFTEYAAMTLALYRAIREVSGRDIIVDSSKNPTRGYALARIPELELSFVQLVRDGRGVAWSLKKAYKKDVEAGVQHDIPPRPVARTAAFWSAVNVESEWVRRRVDPGRHLRVRYEDFVTDPRRELRRVGDVLGLDYEGVVDAVERGDIAPAHTIAGNRLRMTGTIKLRLDEAWKEALPPRDLRVFWAIAGWLLRGYGYRWA